MNSPSEEFMKNVNKSGEHMRKIKKYYANTQKINKLYSPKTQCFFPFDN